MTDAEQLQRVVDELEIRNLLARIHNTIDDIRAGGGAAAEAAYDADWTPDGIWESPTLGTYQGHEGHRKRRAEAAALAREGGAEIPAAGAGVRGHHITVSTEVRLDGDVAICVSKWLYGTTQGTAGEVHQVGRYRDEVRRTPEGWKLHHRLVFP